MKRYGRADIRLSACVAAEAMGFTYGHGYRSGFVGEDFASCYGGWKLVRYETDGGVSDVISGRRLSAGEFVRQCNAIAEACRITRSAEDAA